MHIPWGLIAFVWQLVWKFGKTTAQLHIGRVSFCPSSRSKLPISRQFGQMCIHSLHQHIIPAQIWYDAVHWWKFSRGCCEGWWFYEYLNVSWRSTPDFAGCCSQIPILILNDKESQLLNWKGIKCRTFIYWREVCVQEMLFVMVRAGTERDWCGKFLFFLFLAAWEVHFWTTWG